MKKSISRIALAAVCLWVLQGSAAARELLIPGGQVIGLQLCNDTVTVAAFDDALGSDRKAAGLQVGDAILAIDGRCVNRPGMFAMLWTGPTAVWKSRSAVAEKRRN